MKKVLFGGKKIVAVFMTVLMLATALMPAVFAADSWIDESLLMADRFITAENTYNIVKGVTERYVVFNNAEKTNQIRGFVVEADINNPDVSLIASYADGDADEWVRTTVRSQAEAYEKRFGYNVVAAVNGSGYSTTTGEPAGILIMNGKNYHAADYRPFFAILKDGTPVIRRSGERTDDALHAVSGMEILITNGRIVTGSDNALHPRTAVGIREDGSLVFFAADGRQQPESCGMTYEDLAHTMLALGSVNAMALDGGGSTTVLTQREAGSKLELRNKPSYGFERNVGASLLICSTAKPTGVFDHVSFGTDKVFCAPLSFVTLDIKGVDENGFVTALPAGGKLELADSSYGSIVGSTFTAGSKTGTTTLNYVLNGEIVSSIPVEISKEADDMITAFFKKIYQAFMNIFNLLQTFMEKLDERGFENIGRV